MECSLTHLYRNTKGGGRAARLTSHCQLCLKAELKLEANQAMSRTAGHTSSSQHQHRVA